MAERWVDEAACKGHLDLFYGPHAERPAARARREAEGRRMCAACPVREPCKTHARTHGEMGLWGGETEAERVAAGFTPRSTPVVPIRRTHPIAS